MSFFTNTWKSLIATQIRHAKPVYPNQSFLQPVRRRQIMIPGGGVSSLSTAWHLSKDGSQEVTVFDHSDCSIALSGQRFIGE